MPFKSSSIQDKLMDISSTQSYFNLKPLLTYTSTPPPPHPTSSRPPIASPNFRDPFEDPLYSDDLSSLDNTAPQPKQRIKADDPQQYPSFTRKGSAHTWWRSLNLIPEDYRYLDLEHPSEIEENAEKILAQQEEGNETRNTSSRYLLELIGLLTLAALLVISTVLYTKDVSIKGLDFEHPPSI